VSAFPVGFLIGMVGLEVFECLVVPHLSVAESFFVRNTFFVVSGFSISRHSFPHGLCCLVGQLELGVLIVVSGFLSSRFNLKLFNFSSVGKSLGLNLLVLILNSIITVPDVSS
jgi:hypothetical protein